MVKRIRLWVWGSTLLIAASLLAGSLCVAREGLAQENGGSAGQGTAQKAERKRAGKPEPAAVQPEKKGEKDNLLEGLSDELLKKLEQEAKGEVQEEPEDPPLIRIGDHMRQVQQRLAERDTGQETIELQAKIIKEIEELLKQLQRNQNQNQSQSSQQNQTARRDQSRAQQQQQQSSTQTGTQAARDGQRVMPRGPDARSKAELERMARAVWGHLPPKVREQMEQAFSASFLPQYEPLIERYFRTLAERGAGVR